MGKSYNVRAPEKSSLGFCFVEKQKNKQPCEGQQPGARDRPLSTSIFLHIMISDIFLLKQMVRINHEN